MAIPRAVREAAERAEAIHKQMYEQKPVETQTDPVEPVVPTPQDPPPLEAVTPTETAVAPPTELPDPQKEDPWEHRYKVLEGKYRAEVPRMAADNRDLRTKLDTLSQQMEQLKSQAEKPNTSLINQEDREKYGDDLLDVIKRASQEQISAKDAEIAELRSRLDGVFQDTAKTAEVNFFDRLGQIAPDWVTINGDESFLRWLDEYDEFTGKTRQDLLSDAETAKDAERVARFFNKWKATQQTSVATSQTALESQVAPDSNRIVVPPTGKRIFTRTDISQFYAAARRGEIPPKEMVAMEAEIHSATIEGRVR
jgi:hypothetical protein